MTLEEYYKDTASGESQTVEFKSWVKASGFKEVINLAVDELIAFANADGGTVYFGVEDDGTVTGCTKYDTQQIIEAIYDKTRPPLFTKIDVIKHPGGDILAIHVKHDGITYASTNGKCLKRLGKNSKPYYPEEMSYIYSSVQNPDFSARLIAESSENDINKLAIYSLKEKLRARDSESTLPDMEDTAFIRDLGFVSGDNDTKLTIAGLLFIGKDQSINRLLPQAEVIYLHYSEDNQEEYDARLDLKTTIPAVIDRLTEKIQDSNRIVNVQVGLFRLEISDFSERVFQEALLNALAHRDYQSQAAVYVKHYSDKIVIENPGGFPEGVNEHNIITHPSTPRNKLIAESLQRLKYVQRTGQGVDIIFRDMVSSGKPYPEYRSYNDAVTLTMYSSIDDMNFVKFIANEQNSRQKNFSLQELMILRYLTDNGKTTFSELETISQSDEDDTRKGCSSLVNDGLIELSGREYMLTARVYERVKKDVDYTRDKLIQYVRAKEMIIEYTTKSGSITNEKVRELCGFTRQQARSTLDRMRKEKILVLNKKGKYSSYSLIDGNK